MKIGDTVLKVAMARTSRTLATLVASGVDIIKSLEIAANTAGNGVIEDALYEVRYRVEEGVPIAQPLLDNPVFPPMVSQMVKIGEETGELDKMLSKVADFYEDEVDAAVGALTSIIEPVMMLGVGLDRRRDHHLDVHADVQDAPGHPLAPPPAPGSCFRPRGMKPTHGAGRDTAARPREEDRWRPRPTSPRRSGRRCRRA